MTDEEALKAFENKLFWNGGEEYDLIAISSIRERIERGKIKITKNCELFGWIPVAERLPKKHKESWERYIVCVMRSHFPTSSYDICDSPYSEEFVTTAMYDDEQKLWHLDWDEVLNALMDIEDSPLNGDFVTHWMEMPAPPKEVI